MRLAIFSITAALVVSPAGLLAQGRGGGPPSVSVRPPDSRRILGATPGLLGWRVGAPTTAFGSLSFSEAAGKADAAGLAFVEGVSSQQVSSQIPKNLDFNLSAAEIASVRNRLAELRLRMLAYRIDAMPADDAARRKVFGFAKALGADTIITSAGGTAPDGLDKLANEIGMNVALESKDLKSLVPSLSGMSKRMGVAAEIGAWSQAKDRLLAVNLRDRAATSLSQFFLEIVRGMPEPEEFPTKCSNCGRPTGELKPLYLSVSGADVPRLLEGYEKAVRPAMGYRVDRISRVLPITSVDRVPPDERQKIEAALPRQALVKPKKPRKLLVIDLSPAGGYYHATVAHANLALQLMAKNTGAYEPVFSNDLSNLKYPKVKQFDAVFLNSVVGEVFPDPDVLNGLLRFVREGGGVAGIHGSTYASMNLPEYSELMGAADGPHRVEPAILRPDDPDSPLTKMFGGKKFPYIDEFYHFLPTGPFSRDKLHVLISIDPGDKEHLSKWNVRPDNDYGLTWIKSYGKGRVFNCAMGHTPTLFATPPLAEHILAAIQFVLGDLEADTTPSSKMAAKKR